MKNYILNIILINILFTKLTYSISSVTSTPKNSIDEADQSIIISNIFPTAIINGGLSSPYLQEETTDKDIKSCNLTFKKSMNAIIESLKSYYSTLPSSMIKKAEDYIIMNKQLQDIIFKIRNYDFFGLNNNTFAKEYNPKVSVTQYNTTDILSQCKMPTDIFRQCSYENDIFIPISNFAISESPEEFNKEIDEKFSKAEGYKLCSKNYLYKMKEVLQYIITFSPPAPPEVIKNAHKYMVLQKYRLDIETKLRYYEEFITNNIPNGYQVLAKLNVPIVAYNECIDRVTHRKI
jgi:hypothetical protein